MNRPYAFSRPFALASPSARVPLTKYSPCFVPTLKYAFQGPFLGSFPSTRYRPSYRSHQWENEASVLPSRTTVKSKRRNRAFSQPLWPPIAEIIASATETAFGSRAPETKLAANDSTTDARVFFIRRF